MKRLFITLTLAFLLGCNASPEQQQKMLEMEVELAQAKELNARLLKELESKPPLVHLVFLTLKPEADIVAVKSELSRLQELEEVASFELGDFEDLADPRSMSDYGIIMYTAFQDTSSYRVYQTHPTHLEVRKNLKPMLAAPPAVYDYRR